MKRCTIIYNPNSGKGTFKKHLVEIQSYLTQQGFTWNIVETKYPKHASDLFKSAALDRVDLVIVGGGDGTMNEVTQSIPELSYVPPIGYIPSGTANDLGKTLGLQKKVPKTLNVFEQNQIANIDILTSNYGVFNYIAAIGNYVDISYKTTKKMKKVWGFLAYILFGIKAFFTTPMIKAEIITPEKKYSGRYSLILVVNSHYVAGFSLNPKAKINDGNFEVIMVPYVPILNNVYFFSIFLLKSFKLPGIVRTQANQIEIKTDHARAWSLDGEVAKAGDFKATLLKQRLPIVINPEKAEHILA